MLTASSLSRICLNVQTHNGNNRPRSGRSVKPGNWHALKGRIITRFGSINAAALRLGCHRNSLRAAALGKCPGILTGLEKALNE